MAVIFHDFPTGSGHSPHAGLLRNTKFTQPLLLAVFLWTTTQIFQIELPQHFNDFLKRKRKCYLSYLYTSYMLLEEKHIVVLNLVCFSMFTFKHTEFNCQVCFCCQPLLKISTSSKTKSFTAEIEVEISGRGSIPKHIVVLNWVCFWCLLLKHTQFNCQVCFCHQSKNILGCYIEYVFRCLL